LVVSLLPAPFHPQVMEEALKLGKHCVTSSYVSPAMEVRARAMHRRTPPAPRLGRSPPQPARVARTDQLVRPAAA
jgi:hypothetical protein